jgi:hypothetical protein
VPRPTRSTSSVVPPAAPRASSRAPLGRAPLLARSRRSPHVNTPQADPDNRLVTAELERRWEEALRTYQEAEDRLRQEEALAPRLAIPADLLQALKDLGPQLPELWQSKLLKTSQKKSLLRALIDKVVLQRVATDKVSVRLVWRGGQTTAADVRVSVSSFTRLSDLKELKETALRLACEGQTDEQIATALTAKGHCAPDGGPIRVSSVRKLRWANRVLHFPKKSRPPRKAGYLTLSQVAEKLHIRTDRLYYYVQEGKLAVKRDAALNCYLIPDKPSTVRQIGQLLAGQIDRLAF